MSTTPETAARTLLEAKYGKYSPSFKSELKAYREAVRYALEFEIINRLMSPHDSDEESECDCFSMGKHNCPEHGKRYSSEDKPESVPWSIYRPGQFSE